MNQVKTKTEIWTVIVFKLLYFYIFLVQVICIWHLSANNYVLEMYCSIWKKFLTKGAHFCNIWQDFQGGLMLPFANSPYLAYSLIPKYIERSKWSSLWNCAMWITNCDNIHSFCIKVSSKIPQLCLFSYYTFLLIYFLFIHVTEGITAFILSHYFLDLDQPYKTSSTS